MTPSSPITRSRSGSQATPFQLPSITTQNFVEAYLSHFPSIYWIANQMHSKDQPKKIMGFFNVKSSCMYLYSNCPRHREISKILTNLQIPPKAEATDVSKDSKVNKVTLSVAKKLLPAQTIPSNLRLINLLTLQIWAYTQAQRRLQIHSARR